MWRRPEFQRFEEESEFVPSFLFCEAEHFKDPGLNIATMDPNRASSDFRPIEHEVIRLCPHPLRMCLEQFKIFIHWRGEGMVSGDPSIFARIEFQQRKVDNPEHVPPALGNPVLFASKLQTQRTEQVQSGFSWTGHHENGVAFYRARLLNHGVDSRPTGVLHHRRGGDAVFADFDPRNAGTAELLHVQGEIVKLLARIRRLRSNQTADRLSRFCGLAKYTSLTFHENVCEILYENAKPRVRFVATVPIHSLLKIHARQRDRYRDAFQRKDLRH